MKKMLLTVLLALTLLVVTIYSASAIQIVEIENREVQVGVGLTQQVSLVDNQNISNITYGLVSSPQGMTINNNGLILWTPMFNHNQVQNVVVNVSALNETSGDVVYDEESFTLTITHTGFTMSLNTASAPRSALIEREYRYELAASSNREGAVEGYTYFLLSAPDGMVMNNEGVITWTPNSEQFGTHTVTVSAIPLDAPASINASSTFNINVQGLSIDRVEVRADSRRLETISRANYLEGSFPYVVTRDAKLGETIELRISIRNNLPSGTENELRDVELEIISYDLESADGQNVEISRIRSGSSEDQTMTFILDDDLHPDDSPFDLEIRVTGETRDGVSYSDVWELELTIETKNYDLLMSNFAMTPTTVCPGERARITMAVRNIGTRDLTNAGIRFYFSELELTEWERPLSLDYGDSLSISRFITIPQNTAPGEYFLEVSAYPRVTSSSDVTTQMHVVTVRNCGPTAGNQTPQPPIISPPPSNVVVPGTPITNATGTRSSSIFDRDNNLYTILLTALVVLVLIGVILLLVAVFRKN